MVPNIFGTRDRFWEDGGVGDGVRHRRWSSGELPFTGSPAVDGGGRGVGVEAADRRQGRAQVSFTCWLWKEQGGDKRLPHSFPFLFLCDSFYV